MEVSWTFDFVVPELLWKKVHNYTHHEESGMWHNVITFCKGVKFKAEICIDRRKVIITHC